MVRPPNGGDATAGIQHGRRPTVPTAPCAHTASRIMFDARPSQLSSQTAPTSTKHEGPPRKGACGRADSARSVVRVGWCYIIEAWRASCSPVLSAPLSSFSRSRHAFLFRRTPCAFGPCCFLMLFSGLFTSRDEPVCPCPAFVPRLL